MYAFLSHTSALDVLRTIEGGGMGMPLWPVEPRELPRHRNTVTTQRMFKEFAASCNLASYGITRIPVDLLVPKASQRSRGASARFHAWKGDVPTGSMIIERLAAQVAERLGRGLSEPSEELRIRRSKLHTLLMCQ